jgi:hypothetical protein
MAREGTVFVLTTLSRSQLSTPRDLEEQRQVDCDGGRATRYYKSNVKRGAAPANFFEPLLIRVVGNVG